MRFAPRLTLSLLGGFLLFMLIAFFYAVLPVWREPVPPGAIPDYARERVMARLDGKVSWMLGGSLLVAGFVGMGGLRRLKR